MVKVSRHHRASATSVVGSTIESTRESAKKSSEKSKPLWFDQGQVQFQSPRQSFYWITWAQLICTLPHISYIPLWVSLLCAWCVVWRWMIFQGRWSFPGKILRYGLVIAALFGLMLQYPRILSVEAAVTLLVITYYLKLLEMFRLKDVYVILILSYFVMASAFLLYQSLLMLGYFSMAFIATTTALFAANRTTCALEDGGNLRKGLQLCAQALPIGLILFVLFPRIDPFWTIEIKKPGPTVGISDSMSVSDVAQLGASEGVAFRAEFNGSMPSPAQRYWRVLTLADFDGLTWRSVFSSRQAQLFFQREDVQRQAQSGFVADDNQFNYVITLEPSEQSWLPVLDVPTTLSGEAQRLPDFTYQLPKIVDKLYTYQGTSHPDNQFGAQIGDWSKKLHTRLPAGYNPKATAFAKALFAKHNSLAGYAQAILQYFNQEPFFYTLEPGKYGQDGIDEFLFGRRQGFCGHYASAMVHLLRAADIPARLVVGYHGGEINPIGGHFVVNQFDAHAWVEAWAPGIGWQRFDPTAAVAPWRVTMGVQDRIGRSNGSDAEVQTSLLRSNRFMNRARLLLDYGNYRWQKYVVNFDREQQQGFIRQAFGRLNLMQMLGLLFGVLFGVLTLLAIVLLFRQRRPRLSAIDRALELCLKRIGAMSRVRRQGETLGNYAMAIKDQLTQSQQLWLGRIVDLYQQLKYHDLDHASYQQRKRRLLVLARSKPHQAVEK